MKVVLFTILSCLLFVGFASASPFVVADAQGTDVERYSLSINGGTYSDVTPTTVSGGKQFRYDTASLANGTYIMRVKACNAYGCSADSSPFSFSKTIPSTPTGLRLEL